MTPKRLPESFFARDCLAVAPALVGKLLVHRLPDGTELCVRITETEAYRGEEDKACHAAKGRTKRTEVLYGESGVLYVYLCYGMHWLMNVVTGAPEQPQAVLLRAGEGCTGPARLTKRIQVDGSFNRCPLAKCRDTLWFADDGFVPEVFTAPRVGIAYAGEEWANKPWRFVMQEQ